MHVEGTPFYVYGHGGSRVSKGQSKDPFWGVGYIKNKVH